MPGCATGHERLQVEPHAVRQFGLTVLTWVGYPPLQNKSRGDALCAAEGDAVHLVHLRPSLKAVTCKMPRSSRLNIWKQPVVARRTPGIHGGQGERRKRLKLLNRKSPAGVRRGAFCLVNLQTPYPRLQVLLLIPIVKYTPKGYSCHGIHRKQTLQQKGLDLP